MNNKILLVLVLISLIPVVQAFELNVFETSKSVCSGSTILFTAVVTGDGYFDVNKGGSAGAWATIVPNSFVLNDNSKTVYVYVTPNSNVIPGDYNLELIVSNEQETKTETFNVNVNSCHNIQISGDLSKEMCGCDLNAYSYTILNTGNYDEYLDIEIGGSAKDFIILSQDSLLVPKSQSKILYAYVDVPCNIEGNYDFTIKLENNNIISSFDSDLKVNNCFNFDLNTDKDYVNFCEHSIENIDVSIKNLGKESNDFYIDVLGPLWANVDKNKVNINSLQEKSVNLIFNPDYNVKGTFDVILEVESDLGKIKKSKEIIADVKQCHGVILDVFENKATICAGLENNYEVKVKNIGEFEKDFILQTSEEWTRLDENLITLDAGEEESINLEISPDLELLGNYNVYIKTSALDSSLVESEDKIEIKVVSNEDCYMPEIKADDLEVNIDSSATLPIVIENKGNQITDYNIIISGDGSSFSQINPANIKDLEPGKSEVIYLYVAPSLEINKGTYKLNIGVMKEDIILKNKYVNINVKEAVEYKAEKEGFFDKIIKWIKGLFIIEEVKVEEEIIDFKEEKVINRDTKFVYNEEEHNLRIMNVSENSVTIVIESSPVIVLLDINETKEIDINNDGINDLIITLDNIENNMPYIRIKEIVEEEILEEVVEEEFIEEEFEEELINISEVEEAEELANISEEEELLGIGEVPKESLWNKIWNYKNYILYGIIIVIILIILFKIFGKGEEEEEFLEEEKEEEEEETKEEEPLRIGRWIVGLIILGVLIYLAYNYNLLNWNVFLSYLSIYKYYILVGIIFLIILLLIIGYWKNIVDFFEEEVEEEEKEVKKRIKKKNKKRKRRI